MTITKIVDTDDSANGQRVDIWLSDQLQREVSRSRLQQLIKQGKLTVDGNVINQAKTQLKAGQHLSLELPDPVDPRPKAENIALDILYEDEDLIVINKAPGLVVHPGNGNWEGTLVNALIHHCGPTLSGIGGVRRPGIVHRLDKNTSGVMVVAKNDFTHKALSEQFADHGRTGVLERKYIGLVWGRPERTSGRIESYLGRSLRERTKQAVVNADQSGARHAVTHYTLIETYVATDDRKALASLIECKLETGRTHQIRVHMAHIGLPLIGDFEYGRAFKTKSEKLPPSAKALVHALGRQALHARTLTFEHPRKATVLTFAAEPPADMAKLIASLRAMSL